MGREGLTYGSVKMIPPERKWSKKEELQLLQLCARNINCSHVTLLFTRFNGKFVKKKKKERTFNFKRKSPMILLSVNRKIIYWIIQNNNRLDVYSRRVHNRFTLLHSYAHFPLVPFSRLSVIFALIRNGRCRGRKSKLDHAIICRKILHVAKA